MHKEIQYLKKTGDLEKVIRTLFRRWSKLKFWKCDMNKIELTIDHNKTATYTQGLADYDTIKLTLGRNQSDALATLLHELAHTACFRREISFNHDLCWQIMFLKAAEYIIDDEIIVNGYSGTDIQLAISKAFAKKFKLKVPRGT